MTRQEFLRGVGLAALAASAWSAAAAQTGGHTEPGAETAPSTRAYMAAAERMHRDMDFAYSGDVDIDFARAMIVHHRGAIEMAQVVLEHSTDPDIRDLAEEIVAAQEAEINFLDAFLARKAVEAEADQSTDALP